MKVVICVPTLTRPHQVTLDSIRAEVPLLDTAKIEHSFVTEIGCPYISAARATMLRKALDAKADVIVFIDHDVSWPPGELLKLIHTDGDVIAGTYRFKEAEERYMGVLAPSIDGRPRVRESDGAIAALKVPAGFLKVTRNAVNRFMEFYPELCYGEHCASSVDLFNHGAHKRVWEGEDYAFSRRWIDAGGQIWLVPDLNLDHHSADAVFKGNFHSYMLRQPGGSESDNPAVEVGSKPSRQ